MASVNNHETQINDLKNNKHIIAGISHYKSSTEIDANTISDNTIYHVSSSITNAPVTNYGELITLNPGTRHQIYISDSSGLYYRKSTEGWRKVWLQNDAITNAVWNDYAEFYERGEYTEPGDIIGLNPNSDKEEYIKATNPSMCVGVHSDEYGHLIGGEQAPEGKDFVEYNMDKFIPVGLVGRVKTKIIGKISIGDKIVLSNIPGVGRKFIKGIDDSENIIGMAVENKTDESISRIRAHLRMGGGN